MIVLCLARKTQAYLSWILTQLVRFEEIELGLDNFAAQDPMCDSV